MRRFLLILFLVTTYDVGAEPCTDRPECWPRDSAMHTGLTAVAEQQRADRQLAAEHKTVIRLLSETVPEQASYWPDGRLVAALKSQQTAWLHYRSEECELIGALTGAGGSWPSTYAGKCALNHARRRLSRVRAASRCIQSIPVNMRSAEAARCLQQLAPLTNILQ